MQNVEELFRFFHCAEKLKDTLRYNQTSGGRKESSAEHSWRLALMVFVIAEEYGFAIDINRSVAMAIVHDLAEAITGDIDSVRIAEGEITKKQKNEMEAAAMAQIKDMLSQKMGCEITSLWNEYESGETQEAKFVKALDKIETLTQLAEAGHEFYDKPEFIANYADRAVLAFPQLMPMLKVVKSKLKKEFEKGGLEWKNEYEEIIEK